MRMSHLFGQTLREAPADAQTESHSLLVRAGFLRPVAPGLYAYLPLGRLALRKAEAVLREELDALGAQEVSLPTIAADAEAPEHGRRFTPISLRAADAVASREIQSHRHLPRLLYQVARKQGEEAPARGGLFSLREFTVLDCHGFAADARSLARDWERLREALERALARCGIPHVFAAAEATEDVPPQAGEAAGAEAAAPSADCVLVYPAAIAPDALLECGCGYRAPLETARFRRPRAPAEEPRPIQKVHTPGCASIEDLSIFLGVPKARTAKAVFMIATMPSDKESSQRFVFAVVRGDMEVSESKLARALGALALRPATEAEIRAVGAEPGFASPIGLESKEVLVVVDEAVASSPNLVAGANEPDYHLLNTNCGRDYAASLVADIAAAGEGFACPRCGEAMQGSRGVEIAHLRQLGTCGGAYLDSEGRPRPVHRGACAVGLDRLLACAAEEHHDSSGLVWPRALAPYPVHLVLLRGKGAAQAERASERLYTELTEAGIGVLFDDRSESPGVKFADADLIGLPVRLTVSERSLGQDSVELKLRSASEKSLLPLGQTVDRIRELLRGLA